MRDHARAPAPTPFWRFIADLLTGRLDRRILALIAETERLADRVEELEQRVAHQDDRLKTLMDLLPRAMVRSIDAEVSPTPPLDRRKMH